MDPVLIGLAVLAAIVLFVVLTHKPKSHAVVETAKAEAPAQESAPAVEPEKEVTLVASKPARKPRATKTETVKAPVKKAPAKKAPVKKAPAKAPAKKPAAKAKKPSSK